MDKKYTLIMLILVFGLIPLFFLLFIGKINLGVFMIGLFASTGINIYLNMKIKRRILREWKSQRLEN